MKKTTEVELTLQQQRAFVDSGGSVCPRCESYKLTEETSWRDDDFTFMSIESCDSCGLKWTNVFDLVAIHNIVEVKNDK